ncbi:hypothetical protein COS55_01860 [Candidatus Shapirobacteria bacterium CG03_land_8_20_14_0_80_40_19]|uniref:DUF5660 domain-containing protein n=4 Tax=Candidatus Shapironibacteriota TaxID=1752721 RepID=A0A2M7BE77_9BACT|nr:MAG: hypothetical protein COV89_03490 [Candidatus Shapirobacteria bacterium CG11_big_fil_rev_8_21_14_0_20_40_12]PIV01415.1 MAG: hypothetical protein COS55_01860 [Candidatus Shapirobacteria bacterium CG03_land_8_20_14_0_80_40_19]PJC29008.1 MAG: hypothetical protein CO053_01575 [Candidatus Shapirobacteria bacterium CG_4_9_14_0_2_um_filter_40_11]PJC77343.1 MAG: hypothetical protein CO010_00700 [Candidatus Shapirobacteria bacterium CG_4_8_14_3_um_filter_39_11]
MTQQNNNQKLHQPKKTSLGNDSFLESLRGIGNNTLSSVKNDLFKPGVKDIFDNLSPFSNFKQDLQPDLREKPPLDDNFGKENHYQQKRQFEIVKREERIIFTRAEKETQAQVQNLQTEIRKLAIATGDLTKEVQVAIMQEEVNPGVYHVNFLQKLYLWVKSLTAQVKESSYCLSVFNKKSQKKKSYWNQFKKSGSSFSLHHDRAVATQAG